MGISHSTCRDVRRKRLACRSAGPGKRGARDQARTGPQPHGPSPKGWERGKGGPAALPDPLAQFLGEGAGGEGLRQFSDRVVIAIVGVSSLGRCAASPFGLVEYTMPHTGGRKAFAGHGIGKRTGGAESWSADVSSRNNVAAGRGRAGVRGRTPGGDFAFSIGRRSLYQAIPTERALQRVVVLGRN